MIKNEIGNNCELHNVVIGSSNIIKNSSFISNSKLKDFNLIGLSVI